MTSGKTLIKLTAAVAAGCFAMVGGLSAASTDITYAGTGTFASPPLSGADTLELAGEPFAVSITLATDTTPYKTGSNYTVYNKLKLIGQVTSGLLGPSAPVSIASSEATLELAIDPGKFDQLTLEAPIKVIGIDLTIKAVIQMPLGTIKSTTLQPFKAVALNTSDNCTYSDSTATTELAIASGTISAKE